MLQQKLFISDHIFILDLIKLYYGIRIVMLDICIALADCNKPSKTVFFLTLVF